MKWKTIKKDGRDFIVHPNLENYDEGHRSFDWNQARKDISGLPGAKGLNIAYECVDRHALGAKKNHLALRWLGKDGTVKDYTYEALFGMTNRFANVLRDVGVQKGDRVFSLLGRVPELYFGALGTLKNRSVFCPLFSAFGPEPIEARMSLGDGKALITTKALFQKKIAPILEKLPSLEHLFLIDGKKFEGNDLPAPKRKESFKIYDLQSLLSQAGEEFRIEATDPQDMALLHFTSGTTGRPKGAIHVHEAIVAHHMTGKIALDFHPEDVFWCTADPGWVTGTSYGILSPLSNGITSIVDEAEFDARRWYEILQEQKVTVLYTAPTAIRMLMKAGDDLSKGFSLKKLRFIASVGEPLNPEAVTWGKRAFGLPIHDNWWQTETGGIMLSNYSSMDIKPGSMGKPMPGIKALIVKRKEFGEVEVLEEPNAQGELALKVGWPSMFRGYLHEDERYQKCFSKGLYFTGDLAKRDEDGYFWFIGRSDDVIKSAGHLIGPFEVESALMEHEAVAEAAVIGKPDPTVMEVVKAFIELKTGYVPSEDLALEILGHARKVLGPAVAPKEIEFCQALPKTRSGKIMRRLLKARELGDAIGDISTLENVREYQASLNENNRRTRQ